MLIQYDISESVGIRLDCKTEIEPLDVFVSASRSVGFALLMDNCAIVIELSRTVHSDNWYWPFLVRHGPKLPWIMAECL